MRFKDMLHDLPTSVNEISDFTISRGLHFNKINISPNLLSQKFQNLQYVPKADVLVDMLLTISLETLSPVLTTNNQQQRQVSNIWN